MSRPARWQRAWAWRKASRCRARSSSSTTRTTSSAIRWSRRSTSPRSAGPRRQEIDEIMALALRINDFLVGLFLGIGIRLVDFKVEFGRLWDNEQMRIVLADEISPDCCRLWDVGHLRQARQGPLPPRPGRRARGLPGSCPPARRADREPAAQGQRTGAGQLQAELMERTETIGQLRCRRLQRRTYSLLATATRGISMKARIKITLSTASSIRRARRSRTRWRASASAASTRCARASTSRSTSPRRTRQRARAGREDLQGPARQHRHRELRVRAGEMMTIVRRTLPTASWPLMAVGAAALGRCCLRAPAAAQAAGRHQRRSRTGNTATPSPCRPDAGTRKARARSTPSARPTSTPNGARLASSATALWCWRSAPKSWPTMPARPPSELAQGYGEAAFREELPEAVCGESDKGRVKIDNVKQALEDTPSRLHGRCRLRRGQVPADRRAARIGALPDRARRALPAGGARADRGFREAARPPSTRSSRVSSVLASREK